jgi:hypothetical protein
LNWWLVVSGSGRVGWRDHASSPGYGM